MRILIISYHFPPYNNIGAVRVGKMARYLLEAGHDVRVIAARDAPSARTLPVEIPEARIVRTKWVNLRKPAEIAVGGRGASGARTKVNSIWRTARQFVQRNVWPAYRSIVYFPDMQIGWFPFAYQGALELCAEWLPDVILASALPATSLLVASRVSAKLGVPWVAEFRDLWTDSHAYSEPAVRAHLERALERRIVSTSTALVTVSEPLACQLRQKYSCPVTVVTNGFDRDDYPSYRAAGDRRVLRLVYTGSLYPAKQDPTPLFQAISNLQSAGQRIRLDFYGPDFSSVEKQAREAGLLGCVNIHGVVSYAASLSAQREADILLLLLWNDRSQRGVFTGKLFEYLGARRPIIAVGQPNNVAGDLVRSERAGVATNSVADIETFLRAALDRKEQDGSVPDLAPETANRYSRRFQAQLLEQCLLEAIGESSTPLALHEASRC